MTDVPLVTPIRPQLAVSASIFRDGKVLLVQRAYAPAQGSWSVPGGRVEFGEPLHAALAREVMEETGLRIAILGLAGWREVLPASSGGRHFVVMSFAARWAAGEPILNDECADFAWLPPDALGPRTLTPGLQEIIDAARVLVEA
ncbi:NUDIX hydrolase [Tardiphaga sp.]|uniref:NUDIX hydrolase n=1 Tax=Tardiphaga sp. TaxID=1926292 RepID=UPI001992F360|nr:NUDIX hydrolase [Tardiphaga sp.]MBC7578838.1 NUDIX hydrolase [Tardiphaga sp.]